MPIGPDNGLMTGSEKADWLFDFIESSWQDLPNPCSEVAKELALAFARQRREAFNPTCSVLVHGDAHSNNTLQRLDGIEGFKFIDPDGLFAEPACDLAIPMRGFNEELLAGNIVAIGQARCSKIAALTDVADLAIWQWGFIERVSTGLLMLQIGMEQWGRETLAVADLLSSASIPWNEGINS